MNRNETTPILALLTEAWPWADWPEGTLSLWQEALRPYEVEHAATAADIAIATLERPPTIAWFHAACRAERDRTNEGVRSLPAAPVDKEAGRRLAAAARDALHQKMPGSLSESIRRYRESREAS
jgi:hypothetical protein